MTSKYSIQSAQPLAVKWFHVNTKNTIPVLYLPLKINMHIAQHMTFIYHSSVKENKCILSLFHEYWTCTWPILAQSISLYTLPITNTHNGCSTTYLLGVYHNWTKWKSVSSTQYFKVYTFTTDASGGNSYSQ